MRSRRPSSSPSSPQGDLYYSHALGEVLRRGIEHPVVLDLGPAVQSNFHFWAERGGVVHVADLHGGRDRGEFPPRLEFDEPLDVVFAWDLFEYLEGEQARQLTDWILPSVRREGLLYALFSSHGRIPLRPSRFSIRDPEHILQDRMTETRRPSPPRRPGLLSGFVLLHSYLLRHGWQEHLLVRRP